jgi:hypothetical protein
MSPGLTTERVYAVLKAQIMQGERAPGARLDPAKLAAELNASATPVRDALHQLLGERMVQAWPSQGFQVPVPSESGLRALYGWNGDIIGLLLRTWKPGSEQTRELGSQAHQQDSADLIRVLFEAMAVHLGNAEHQIAIGQASDRLHRARKAEAAVFADLAAEQDALRERWRAGHAGELRAALQRYHRRRQIEVPAIVAWMLRETPGRRL